LIFAVLLHEQLILYKADITEKMQCLSRGVCITAYCICCDLYCVGWGVKLYSLTCICCADTDKTDLKLLAFAVTCYY